MPQITIERMSHDDVPAVMAVDNLCFPTPWSENAYRSEMGNVSAYYLVARAATLLRPEVAAFRAWLVAEIAGSLRPPA